MLQHQNWWLTFITTEFRSVYANVVCTERNPFCHLVIVNYRLPTDVFRILRR